MWFLRNKLSEPVLFSTAFLLPSGRYEKHFLHSKARLVAECLLGTNFYDLSVGVLVAWAKQTPAEFDSPMQMVH